MQPLRNQICGICNLHVDADQAIRLLFRNAANHLFIFMRQPYLRIIRTEHLLLLTNVAYKVYRERCCLLKAHVVFDLDTVLAVWAIFHDIEVLDGLFPLFLRRYHVQKQEGVVTDGVFVADPCAVWLHNVEIQVSDGVPYENNVHVHVSYIGWLSSGPIFLVRTGVRIGRRARQYLLSIVLQVISSGSQRIGRRARQPPSVAKFLSAC
mmetsp:Transcript_31988/g.52847  ORF Transcript_31988/g.52847 Transcript_31988/m.52847 type:complete len:208 (-) Transcript_31988:189-812(-)